MDYETAVKQLGFPDTWCKGAQALAELGDPQALVPLIEAYEQDFEASRLCLLDAMEVLNPVAGAHNLFESTSPDQRRMAAHLMELFASEEHLPYLRRAVHDSDEAVRIQGRFAAAAQVQTPAWEAFMIELLAHDDPRMRAQAIKSLSRRRTDSAREALRQRLAVEPDTDLKREIENSTGQPR